MLARDWSEAAYCTARGEAEVPVKTTLIVAPAALIEQWADEFKTHVHAGILQV